MILTDAQAVGAEQDAEQQEPDHLRQPDTSRDRWNADHDGDDNRELRQIRQGQHMISQCIEQTHDGFGDLLEVHRSPKARAGPICGAATGLAMP